MSHGVWIFRDDEFDQPLYAEPSREDLEDEPLWQAICEAVLEAVDGDGSRFDVIDHGDGRIGWKLNARMGITFVVRATSEQSSSDVKHFLNELAQRYFDEVDDARFPDPGGLEDIVVDVIPPWEV
jgi:hypothetical protein